jgi:hypothetical protein
MFQCFARYGQIIARNVTGNLSHETLLKSLDTRPAFAAAIEGWHIEASAIDSLYARCQLFLRSSDPEDEKLKFFLTQGYYFAQLLGVENTGFNPLNEHAFAGATFYLDTNVLIVAVLYESENAALFDEMVGIANRLGVELRVTRATINEARRVAADRIKVLELITNKLPDELVEHTDDQFILSYLEEKAVDPTLTPAVFLESFNYLDKTLRERWKIGVDDRTEEEIINDRDFSKISETFNESALATRGWGKSEIVLEHDVAHYALILDERTTNPKTWFLTRDRTLAQAALKVDEGETVFCFSLVGFLQSLSPFLTTQAQESTFVDVFSAMLSEQVLPIEPIFEVGELALMAEYHQDVLATPPDQLLRAFDYVKLKTLQGRPYRRSDIPEVSLELRKFLAVSRDEQMRALEVERTRVISEKETEEQRRRAAELLAVKRDAEIQRLKDIQEEMQRKIDQVNTELSEQQTIATKREHRRRIFHMVIGFVLGISVWIWGGIFLDKLTSRLPALSMWPSLWLTFIRLCGALIFSVPAFRFIRIARFSHQLKLGLYALIVIGALISSQALSEEVASAAANYIEIAMLIITLLIAGRVINQNDDSQ